MEGSPSLEGAEGSVKAKKATKAKVARIKARAISHSRGSKYQEKAEIRLQKAIDKQVEKGVKEAEKASLLLTEQPLILHLDPAEGPSHSPRGSKRRLQTDSRAQGPKQLLLSAVPDRDQSPNSTLSPDLSPEILHSEPPVWPSSSALPPFPSTSSAPMPTQPPCDYQWLINESMRRGYEAGRLHEQQQLLALQAGSRGSQATASAARASTSVARHPETAFTRDKGDHGFQEDDIEEGEIDRELSDEEGLEEDLPAFKGLFKPHMFRALLAKAKAVTGLGLDPSTSSERPRDPSDVLFSEASETVDIIPASKLFLQIIGKQLEAPGSYANPTAFDKKFFNVSPELSTILETPEVDEPVVALATPTASLADAEDVLRPEERRNELTIRKAHQAAAWAVKTATAASFFSRAALLWLKQIQERVPAQDVRTHQQFNKIVAATEFTADATFHSAKFGARSMASAIAARRLLWLKHWQADAKRKWRLASAPCKAGKLFGEVLDPILVETRDRKKRLPSLSRRGDRISPPRFRGYNQRPQFAGPPPQRSYRPPNQRQDFLPAQGFRDRNRSQAQAKRPFRGAGGRPFRRSR